MSYEYFHGKEADKFMFYRIPKLLFEIEGLKQISSEAKIMYGMLLDRVGLSAENGWIDSLGRVYIIYTVAEARRALGCSEKKAVGVMKELEVLGLIEKKRRGMGKPNLIYVKNFLSELTEIQLKGSRYYSTGTGENTVHELSGLPLNNNYMNNTDKNDTDYDPIRIDKQDPVMEERAAYRELVMENIGYRDLIREQPMQKDIIEQMVELMTDVMCSDEPQIRIGKEDRPRQVVKSVYSKLGRQHIEYVLGCIRKSSTEIRNMKNYLITALYYAPMTMGAHRRSENFCI